MEFTKNLWIPLCQLYILSNPHKQLSLCLRDEILNITSRYLSLFFILLPSIDCNFLHTFIILFKSQVFIIVCFLKSNVLFKSQIFVILCFLNSTMCCTFSSSSRYSLFCFSKSNCYYNEPSGFL